MESPHAALKARFTGLFGPGAAKIHVIRAPGRVNLIGEHTDYNEGFVLPMAIEPHVLMVCRSRDDGLVRVASTSFPDQIVEFSVQSKITRGEPAWGNYFRGVAAELIAAGIPLTGMDMLVDNTLPVGGGLSSSAAIEVGTAQAFLTLAGLKMDPARLALVCQKAEHEYALVPCGIMDQTIVASARQGYAMLLDCRDLSRHFVPIDASELRVVIVNSMVRHELTGGEYAERRRQCEQGVRFFQTENPAIKALRDVSLKQLEAAKGRLPDVVYRRCRHVITENQRTLDAASHLNRRQYEEAGELMVQSHRSLRDDYQVSVPELDFLVEQAMMTKGVYGSRLTGGGFGGCTVSLVQPRYVESFATTIQQAYHAKFGSKPAVYPTTATAGVTVLE
ncbi:MAG TPA: galactokinase [Tepidisphaeraceae bacterium]|nr:galactokinase [Tepidisphaeraceae bacterium]